jgi:hypothetical protein
MGNGGNNRSICYCRGFSGADMDTIAGTRGNGSDNHDDGTCFCRYIRRIFRKEPPDFTDYFWSGLRANRDVNGGAKILAENGTTGKLIFIFKLNCRQN